MILKSCMKKLFNLALPLKQRAEKQSIVNEAECSGTRLARFSGLAVSARLFMAGCVLFAASAHAADWPQFRGNTGQTGVASGKLSAAPKIAWKFKTERAVTGAPAIVKGRVYIGSLDGNLYCLNARTGQKIWSFATKDEIEAAPLVLNGVVYIGASDRHFYAVDANSGKEKWKFKTGDKILGGANWFKTSNGGLRLLFGSYDNKMYCLDAANGKPVWSFETENYINGSPAISGGNRAVFGGCDGKIYVLALGTGKQIAEIDSGAYIAASPAMSGSEIYIGSYGNEFQRADSQAKKIVWEYRDRSFPFFSSAALSSDRIFVGSRDKRLHCIARKTGKPLWTFNALGKVDSSPVLCDGKVVFGAENGRLYLVNMTNGQQIWSYDVGKAITGAPAVADGLIVIGSENGYVYGFR